MPCNVSPVLNHSPVSEGNSPVSEGILGCIDLDSWQNETLQAAEWYASYLDFFDSIPRIGLDKKSFIGDMRRMPISYQYRW